MFTGEGGRGGRGGSTDLKSQIKWEDGNFKGSLGYALKLP